MKNYLIISFLLCFALSVAAQKQVTIIHTSDTHSRIEPIAKSSSDPNAGSGGYARRAAYLNELRQKASNLLLVDCGDFSQGTPYYNMFKGEVEVKLMNYLQYDVSAIGNHEFDFGLDNMARLFAMADFPIVCANYDFTGTVVEGLVKPYVVIEREGIKFGIFGLGPQLEGLVSKDNYKGVVYKDPVAAANEVAALLKEKEACDMVVCLSHLGMYTTAAEPIGDENLIPQTRNIDFVFGGHSHTYMTEPLVYNDLDNRPVQVLHIGRNGSFVGKVDITFNK